MLRANPCYSRADPTQFQSVRFESLENFGSVLSVAISGFPGAVTESYNSIVAPLLCLLCSECGAAKRGAGASAT